MDDTEAMEEEIIIRETAAVIGIFALSQASSASKKAYLVSQLVA